MLLLRKVLLLSPAVNQADGRHRLLDLGTSAADLFRSCLKREAPSIAVKRAIELLEREIELLEKLGFDFASRSRERL